MRPPVQAAVAAGSFALGSALAGVAGAANLGTALAFGQIAFAVACVAIMLRA